MLALLLALHTADATGAAEVTVSYAEVDRVLQAHCAGCHNADDPIGGFNADSFEAISAPLDGIVQGPSLIAGDAEMSHIYRYMAGLNEPRMPPEGDGDPVPESDLAVVRAWIDQGAAGPNGELPDRTRLVVPQIETSVAADSLGITAMAAGEGLVVTGRGSRVVAERDGRTLWTRDDLPGTVNDLQVAGPRVVIGTGVTGLSGRGLIVDAATGEDQAAIQGHTDTLYAVALSPDGATLATAGYDRRIELWDAQTGAAIRTLTGHNGAVFDLAWSADGTVLASASADETVKVWDPATGRRLDTMPQPEGEQNAVLITPDMRHVFAAGADNRIRRWRLLSTDQARINPLQIARFAHEQAVTHLAAAGPFIVSAAADRSVKVWTRSGLDLLATHGPVGDVPASLAIDDGIVRVGLMNGQTATFPLPPSAAVPERAVESVRPRLPETDAPMTTLAESETPETLPLPATVEGVVASRGEVDAFGFEAAAGEQWVIEAAARTQQRTSVDTDADSDTDNDGDAEQATKQATKQATEQTIESPIDTVVEVCTADGEPIERVVLEAVRDSYFTFRGKDSSQANDFRLHNWQEMELNEMLYSGGEVVRLWLYPDGPDAGFQVYPGFGKRETLFDTTGVTHALGEPAYIVRAHPPGTKLAPTGLPIVRLSYRNDDAGLQDRGRGSRLTFTAPADGRYQVRIADARGFGGDDFAYSLSVRPRRPDFAPRLDMPSDKMPLLPGAGRELTVSVKRIDEFDGPVRVVVDGLPDGITAAAETVVEAGQRQAKINLFADPGMPQPTPEQLQAATITATATIDGREVSHQAGTLEKLVVKADEQPLVTTTVHLPEEDGIPTLRIRPGETKSMRLSVAHRDAGTDAANKREVKFGKQDAARNLPHGVFVDNIGLNGLMLLAGQTEREFFITAAPTTRPQERLWHLKANQGQGLTSRSVRIVVEPAEGRP